MTLTRVLLTIVDPENGLEAQVAQIGGGYSVVLRDTDSGEFFPEARIFHTEAVAVDHAHRALRVLDGWSVPLN